MARIENNRPGNGRTTPAPAAPAPVVMAVTRPADLPPNDNFSAVEKNVAYVGYCVMELTTQSPSNTSASSPARRAEIAAARPHGPAPMMAMSIPIP